MLFNGQYSLEEFVEVTVNLMILSTGDAMLLSYNCYRPQTKFAKVIFLHLSVHGGGEGGVCLSVCWDTLPRSRYPSWQQTRPPSREHTHPWEQTSPREQTPTGADTPHPSPQEQTPNPVSRTPRSRHPL